MRLDKSLVTNLVSAALIPIGYWSPVLGPTILAVGLFATSGAVTNWLAVYMLFEKVPFLYGSGVVPARFEEFKKGIRELIMGQFFTRANLDRFFADGAGGLPVDGRALAGALDYDLVFRRLSETILASPFGKMLGMFGGAAALEPLRAPFEEKMRGVVVELLGSPAVQSALGETLSGPRFSAMVLERTERIVQARLDELTPAMVKEIVQQMIRKHLGWLVVWGGVLGGLIGLVSSLLPAGAVS